MPGAAAIAADYWAATLSIGFPTSPIGVPVGVQVILQKDAAGHNYVGGGINVGRTLTVLSGSIVQGYYNQHSTGSPLLDVSFSAGGGALIGGNHVINLFSPNADEVGVFSPQVGVSLSIFGRVD